MSQTLTKVGITRATFRRLSRFAGAGKPFKQVTLVERGIRLVLAELEADSSHVQNSFRNPERAHQVGASELPAASTAASPLVATPPSGASPLKSDASDSVR